MHVLCDLANKDCSKGTAFHLTFVAPCAIGKYCVVQARVPLTSVTRTPLSFFIPKFFSTCTWLWPPPTNTSSARVGHTTSTLIIPVAPAPPGKKKRERGAECHHQQKKQSGPPLHDTRLSRWAPLQSCLLPWRVERNNPIAQQESKNAARTLSSRTRVPRSVCESCPRFVGKNSVRV